MLILLKQVWPFLLSIVTGVWGVWQFILKKSSRKKELMFKVYSELSDILNSLKNECYKVITILDRGEINLIKEKLAKISGDTEDNVEDDEQGLNLHKDDELRTTKTTRPPKNANEVKALKKELKNVEKELQDANKAIHELQKLSDSLTQIEKNIDNKLLSFVDIAFTISLKFNGLPELPILGSKIVLSEIDNLSKAILNFKFNGRRMTKVVLSPNDSGDMNYLEFFRDILEHVEKIQSQMRKELK